MKQVLSRTIPAAEVILVATTVVLALLWVRVPDGPYEPWLTLAVVCSAALEYLRRQVAKKDSGALTLPGASPIKFVIRGENIRIVINQTIPSQRDLVARKRWRELSLCKWPMYASVSEQTCLSQLSSDMASALYETYNHFGYTAFTAFLVVSLIEKENRTFRLFNIISYKPKFCQKVQDLCSERIRRASDAWNAGRYEEEKAKMSEEWAGSPLHKWRVSHNLIAGVPIQAVDLRFDPERRTISVDAAVNPSTRLADYPDHMKRTSELLTWIAAVAVQRVAYIGDAAWLVDEYRMAKLVVDILESRQLDWTKIRVNVDDDEEWDYVNPRYDAKVRGLE